MVKVEGDKLIFSSGRTAYANNGIVGLSPKLHPSHGYDGSLGWEATEERDEDYGEDPNDLMDADMIELADHMIERWTAFKNKLAPK